MNPKIDDQNDLSIKGERFGVLAYVVNNILKNRWRTVLTIIGIAIPIAFFILFAGIGDGLDHYIISESEDSDEELRHFEEISKIVKSWTNVLIAIISIMIIISITNTMLISTSTRKFEFGILKALGIRDDQVIFIVLVEAFLISTIALIVGIIIGVWGAMAFDYMFWQQGGAGSFFAPANINLNSIVIASILTICVGTFTSLFPALRISRLKTIDILRCE